MTTLKQAAANKRNAARSTGPRTDDGKVVARMNAVSHGLRAAAPVVPGEDPDQWEQFRDEMVSDLAPVGLLETELADRVALLSWRLRRVTSYESGVIARTSDRAARRVRGEDEADDRFAFLRTRADGTPTVASVRADLDSATQAVDGYARLARLYADLSAAADDARFAGDDALYLLNSLIDYLPAGEEEEDDEYDLDAGELPPSDPMTSPTHPRFLLAVGVPADAHDDPEEWDGWTAAVARLGVERVARTVKWDGARLLARATAGAGADLEEEREKLADRRREFRAAERQAVIDEAEARRRALVPAAETVEVVMKYEAHLQRQMVQALHELERRQALRSDCPPHPPAALDVTVHAPDGVGVPALLDG